MINRRDMSKSPGIMVFLRTVLFLCLVLLSCFALRAFSYTSHCYPYCNGSKKYPYRDFPYVYWPYTNWPACFDPFYHPNYSSPYYHYPCGSYPVHYHNGPYGDSYYYPYYRDSGHGGYPHGSVSGGFGYQHYGGCPYLSGHI